jgi:hypothetical protein
MRKLTASLVLVLVVGCNDPKVSVELTGQTAIPAPPRYQIIINTQEFTGANAEAFLLDTQRGRVWAYNRWVPPGPEEPGTAEHFYPITIIDDEGVIGMTSNDWHSFLSFKKAQRDAKETKAFISSKQAEAEAGKRDLEKHE